ncbi:MAG: hypothetical protein JWO36_5536 [Myxococcales bacterium]|nr:hypothetical protein [Myxococcales bacterium]
MTDEKPSSESADRLSASVDEIEAAIETALTRMDADRKAEARIAAASAEHKAEINKRVSIAALLLTMMLSFLGFVRANSDGDASGDKGVAQQSKNDAATEWTLYQTKTAQRSSFVEAMDTLAREVMSLSPTDPRRELARFHHHEYEAKVALLDDENTQLFHVIQTLNRAEYHASKSAEHHDRRTSRYDMAIRTLTLALVLISVTLLVDRSYLFWIGIAVAAIGGLFGVTGYFLH